MSLALEDDVAYTWAVNVAVVFRSVCNYARVFFNEKLLLQSYNRTFMQLCRKKHASGEGRMLLGGFVGILSQKFWKSELSEMTFPAFWVTVILHLSYVY